MHFNRVMLHSVGKEIYQNVRTRKAEAFLEKAKAPKIYIVLKEDRKPAEKSK